MIVGLINFVNDDFEYVLNGKIVPQNLILKAL